MFKKILVANRGAVAARVLRTLSRLNVPAVAVYSEADANAPYLSAASEAIAIGAAAPKESYLNQTAIIAAARQSGCDAIHPGYGFLSENADFARAVGDAGMTFIGPSAHHIAALGNKARARALAREHGLPVAAGSDRMAPDHPGLQEAAAQVGYPLMVKPAGGGGGIGMLPVHDSAGLIAAAQRASSMAQRGFGNPEIYFERLILTPRHVEVQIMGDRHGKVRHLFERDCSTQRRNQKIIEESPAPGIDPEALARLCHQVAASLQRMGYDNIGTVELLLSPDGTFTFLEVNTRLQVEHGVTEAVTGIDLVEAQLRTAAGESVDHVIRPDLSRFGHAIQARICAEDPVRFFPSPGPLTVFRLPQGEGVRVETGYQEGGIVSPYYDSLVAKIIVHRPTRAAAIEGLIAALEQTRIEGIKTNIPALVKILRSPAFNEGRVHTGLVAATI